MKKQFSGSNINTKFDAHDFEQLLLLAKINRITRTALIRKICKAYLDGIQPKLKVAES